MTDRGKKLTGKIALVTGAGRGLGRAFALRIAGLGADVVINDLSMKTHLEFDESLSAGSVPEEIEAMGVRSLGIEADVTQEDQVRDMLSRVEQEFGRLDILVNNAGGALFGSELRPTMELNLTGTIYCCQSAAPIMKRQKSGKIVNVSSQAGLWTQPGKSVSPYGLAKAGVVHYTRMLAAELGPFNINVNCVAPGWILSSRAIAAGRGSAESRERLSKQIALRRLGEPEDVAKVVEFLVTELSDYVTGQTIPVGGGTVLF